MLHNYRNKIISMTFSMSQKQVANKQCNAQLVFIADSQISHIELQTQDFQSLCVSELKF